MKKTIFALLAMLFVLTGCSDTDSNIMGEYTNFKKKDHHYVTDEPEKIIENIENRVEGVYYIGYVGCPWCKSLVPVLEDVATEYDTTVTYLNIRDEKFVGTDLPARLSEFDKGLPEADRSNNYVPFTIAISKDGEVKTLLGTLTEDPKLSESDIDFLKVRLGELFKVVKPQ